MKKSLASHLKYIVFKIGKICLHIIHRFDLYIQNDKN